MHVCSWYLHMCTFLGVVNIHVCVCTRVLHVSGLCIGCMSVFSVCTVLVWYVQAGTCEHGCCELMAAHAFARTCIHVCASMCTHVLLPSYTCMFCAYETGR